MYYGHDPRDVHEYPWWMVEAFLIALPDLRAATNPEVTGDG